MQLSQDSLQLNLQLNWLLSAEPRLPLGSCIQPKATCLPLGQQLNLALSVARLLQAGRVHDDPAHKLVHENSTELLQLLHLLASEGSTNSCNHSIQQTAQLAVQQHEQAILQQFRDLHSEVHQAVLPSWLPTSNRHCFAWWSRAKQSDPSSTQGRSTIAQPAGPQETSLQQLQQAAAVAVAVGTQEPVAQYHAATDAAEDAAEPGGGPPTKRAKLISSAVQAAPADAATADGPLRASADTAATVAMLVEQLKALDSTCDASGLDLQLLQQTLTAGATAPAVAESGDKLTATPTVFQALHQQLQALSLDALQVLIDHMLERISIQSASQATGIGQVDLQELLLQLLAMAVLPRIQRLSAAAPQPLLMCLVTLAQQQLNKLTSIVLEPLLLSSELLAVQGQLLIRLMKEVPAVQARLLHLLLQGSSAVSGCNSSSIFPDASSNILSTCCWTEAHAVLLKALLDTSPELISSKLDGVVAAVKVASTRPMLQKSKVFGQLMMAIVTSYAAMLNVGHLQQLEAAVAATQTFLSKAVKNKLQQLLRQHTAAQGR